MATCRYFLPAPTNFISLFYILIANCGRSELTRRKRSGDNNALVRLLSLVYFHCHCVRPGRSYL